MNDKQSVFANADFLSLLSSSLAIVLVLIGLVCAAFGWGSSSECVYCGTECSVCAEK